MNHITAHACHPPQKGFTLIEVVASLLITSMLVGIAGLGIVQVAKGFVLTRESGELAQQSDFVLTRIRKSVRNLTQLTTAGSTTLALSRLDNSQAPVTETFSYSGTTLSLNDGTGNDILMEGISAFQLRYFNEDNNAWNPATDPIGELAIVDVSLTMAGNEGVSVAFSERILPRNTFTPSRAYTPAGAGTTAAQGICLLEAIYPRNPVIWGLFREFRDHGLAAIPLMGDKITAAYYSAGSAITPWIGSHPGALPFFRWLAAPLVAVLFFWKYFPAGLLALATAAWILARLFTFALLQNKKHLAPASRRRRTAGSILLSLVITITVVALLGAGAVSMLATSQHGNVHSAFGEKAYYLAESGLRYALNQFMDHQDDSAGFVTSLSSTETGMNGAFSVSAGEAFDLNALCFFFDPADGAPGTTLQAYGGTFPDKIAGLSIPGGGLAGRMEVRDTGISERAVVNVTVLAINAGAGTISYSVTSGLSGGVDPAAHALPVAAVSSAASNVRASNLGEAATASQISLDAFSAFFPPARGLVTLMADADGDASFDDEIHLVYDRLNGTTLQGLRNVPGKEPLPAGGV
ncbi:MAG: PulJ/GspJ family protein, partial [Thermodesulfobacteriota bacterium]